MDAISRGIEHVGSQPIGCRCNFDIYRRTLRNVRYHDIRSMDLMCQYCNALGYKGENKGSNLSDIHFGDLCCSKKRIMLDMFPDHPEALHHLFSSIHPMAMYFRKNIRFFNCGMTMASVQVSEKTV